MKSFKRVLVFGLLLLGNTTINASIFHFHGDRLSSQTAPVIVGSNVTVDLYEPYVDPSFKYLSVSDKITLAVDHSSKQFVPTVGNVVVKLLLQKYDNNKVLTTSYVDMELKYQPFPASGLPYVDKSVFKFDNAYKYKITIQSITINGVATANLPANLYIDTDITVDLITEFDPTLNMDLSEPTTTDIDGDGIADEINIRWPGHMGVEEYQLEWTFVNDYGKTPSTFISQNDLDYDFKNNSTRISIYGWDYKINLAYEHGYLLYRLRGVGRNLAEPSKLIYGAWSYPDKGKVNTVSTKYYVEHEHERNKNWQYSATYAEQGKRKEVISYFDGSLRNRQSVTKINSDSSAIVGETIYDHQGRPAINVLPVPAKPSEYEGRKEMPIKYYSYFNTLNLTEYSRKSFDVDALTDSCSTTITQPMSAGASYYYSSSNENKTGVQAFVPDANLFPFSRTEYTPDNTGRIRRQGGVGKEFQLGQKHETKYYYGAPAQVQLDRLFGSEVGNAAHYKKNVVVDANGQSSITYLDQEGRTVATALAGDAPKDALTPTTTILDPLPSGASYPVTIDLFGKDAGGKSYSNTANLQGDALEFGSQLLVAFGSNYQFNYSVKIDSVFDGCLKTGFCLSCIYDLEIKITNDCGERVITSPANGNPIKKTIGNFTTDASGNLIFKTVPTPSATNNETFTVFLEPGNYTITKRLTVNKAAKEFYVSKYLETVNTPTLGTYVNLNSTCSIKTYQTFLNESLAKVDSSDCNISCQACVTALMSGFTKVGDARDAYVAAGKGTELDFDYLLEQCNAPCKEISVCEANFEMMLMDVSPDGQYGKIPTDNWDKSAAVKLSVFSFYNQLPKSSDLWPSAASWYYPKINVNGNTYNVYLDDNGERSKIIVSRIEEVSNNQPYIYFIPSVQDINEVYHDAATQVYYTYPENLDDVKDFVANWKDSWAKSLVSYHPEYPYYLSCLDYNVKPKNYSPSVFTSDSFDSLLFRCNTYEDARIKGLVKAKYLSTAIPASIKAQILFNVSANATKDPFLFGDGFSAYSPLLLDKLNNYQNGISMAEIAARAARCGTMYGATNPGPNCTTFGLDNGLPNGSSDGIPKSLDLLNQEWNIFKNMYLAEKQKIQKIRNENIARSNGGTNDCIGNQDFNPINAGLITNPLISSPFFQQNQPCSSDRYAFYYNKKKRFNTSNEVSVPTKEENDYQMYLQTGQSPMELNFQGLLNGLAEKSKLIKTGQTLQYVPEFSQDLYMALNGTITPLPPTYVSYLWAGTISGTSVNGNITKAGVPQCIVNLNSTSPVVPNWNNVIGIKQVKFTPPSSGNVYNFTALAVVANPVGSTLPYTFYPITGSTNFILSGYAPSPATLSVCKPNALAVQLCNLWSVVALSANFNTTTPLNLNTPEYFPFLTKTIKNALGTYSNDLRWVYNGSTYELYDQAVPAKKLILQITSGNLTNVKMFTNIKNTDGINSFTMNGNTNTGSFISTITGKVSLVNGATTPVNLGDCGLPESVLCEGKEYQIGKDLFNLLKSVMLPKPFNTNPDLAANNAFTPLLKSYIDISYLSSTTKYDNITINATTFKEQILYNLLCKCKITLWHKVIGNVNMKFANLESLSNLIPYGPSDNASNVYKFYMYAGYRYNSLAYNDTIFGESCFPLRVCSTKTVVDTTFSPVRPYVNPCAKYQLNMAYLNAQNSYKQYSDSITTNIANKYSQRCLNTLETMTGAYTDKEYHYTLYYYDQAGNLIKTIPPEGVELVTNAADFVSINSDRTNNKHDFFTQHTLATTYTYNSLNQLTRQGVPDHDLMNVWEYTLTNGLDSRLKVTASQFVNATKGYLTGTIDFTSPTAFTRGYLYTTDDGGATWTKMNDLLASDLKKIQMLTATIGYAVGNNGVLLKTIDGGTTWDMFTTGVNVAINDLYFNPANTLIGIVIGDAGTILKTVNGGTSWTTATAASITTAMTLTALTYDGQNFYITANSIAGSQIFKALPSSFGTTSFTVGAWAAASSIKSAELLKVQMVSTTLGFAIGVDGNLLKTTTNTTWNAVPSGIANGFKDINFKSATIGVAIIDSVPGKGVIYKTSDGGISWTRLSPADGSYYNAFHFYSTDKGYVVGSNKIKRIVLTGNMGLINIPIPDVNATDLNVVYFTDDNNGWVANATYAYYTNNMTNNIPKWTAIKYNDLGFTIKRLYFGQTENTGLALTTTGALKKIKTSGTTYAFSAFSTTENYADMDVSTTKVYALNKTGTTTNLKSILRTGVSAGTSLAAVTGSNLATAANVNCLDVFSDQLFMLGGKSGLLSKGVLSGTTFTWTDLSSKVAPLSLYDIEAAGTNTIYAVGAEGTLLQTLNGTLWNTIPTNTITPLNAIKFNKVGTTAITAVKGLIAGNDGLLIKTDITLAGAITQSNITVPTTVNLNDIALNTASKAYIAGNEGTVISIPTINTTTVAPVIAATKPGTNFKGIAFNVGSNNAFTVGNYGTIYTYNNTSGAKINAVFTPGLNDVSFINPADGYTIGEKNTVRYTNNGGLSWNYVPSTASATTIFSGVSTWAPGKAVIVGNNGYISNVTGTALTINTSFSSTTNQYKDVKMINGKTGYIVGVNIALKSTNNGTTWATASLPATTTLNAIYIFKNNFLIGVGNSGKILSYNGAWVDLPLTTTITSNFNDVFFHDDLNGYAVGDGGVIYRISTPASIWSYNTTNFGNLPVANKWIAQSLLGNNGVTIPANVNIKTISFATRFKGFIGGLNTTAPFNFARLINDESNLFSTRFWYDRLGRMVLSQNTAQYNRRTTVPTQLGRSDYSYTLYDALGRIVEVGEKTDTVVAANLTPFFQIFGDDVNGKFNPSVINNDKLSAFINTGSARRQVTHTYYDNAIMGLVKPTSQQNLRNRVSSVTYEDRADADPLTYLHATHYSYDIHGNVKSLWQDNQELTKKVTNNSDQGLKRIDYEYDLISGKVNVVRYQDGEPDAFYHFYTYDADNRITAVYTSSYPQGNQVINAAMVNENSLWTMDAKYFYYAHGPLARVELGENKSQGIDYAYTLQGWLKGVNSTLLNENTDMGNDGLADVNNVNNTVGRDAFGYTLNYFQGDYTAIDLNKWNVKEKRFEAYTAASDLMAARYDLYNGNITAMTTTLKVPKLYTGAANEKPTILPQATAYKYDQLNRVLNVQAYTNLNTTDNKWQTGSTYANSYRNAFKYDANGNILGQLRANAAGVTIDSLTYKYTRNGATGTQPNKLLRNRLLNVNDNVNNNAFADDIDNQIPGINYSYDELGNLKADAQEEIKEITWTVYGKIKNIIRTAASAKADMEFKYDASGNRIAKIEKPHGSSKENGGTDNQSLWKNTYYVRDAQGNNMSTYTLTTVGSVTTLKEIERTIYGSSRLGTENSTVELTTSLPTPSPYTRTLGNKYFEGTNHLGNVLCVFTDKKIPRNDVPDGIIDYFQPEVLSNSDYTAFGAPMAERTFSSNKYRYGFNGMEKDDEVKGSGNHLVFGDFGLDTRLGRRWNVDPEISSMPSLSSYSVFKNNPIMFIDPSGRIPYPITIRGFAPFKSFGFGFHGDDRGYTTGNATARVHQRINFDTDKTQIKTTAWSSPSFRTSDPHNQKTATPEVKFEGDFTIKQNGDNKTFGFGTHVAAGNPLTPQVLTPNIDIFSNFSITENKKSGTLNISGKLTGDNFPSTEAFISDPSGQNVFIGIGQIGAGIGKNTGPFTELPGENSERPITDFNFSITTDKKGNFTGIKQGDKTVSVGDWNKQFTDKPTQKKE